MHRHVYYLKTNEHACIRFDFNSKKTFLFPHYKFDYYAIFYINIDIDKHISEFISSTSHYVWTTRLFLFQFWGKTVLFWKCNKPMKTQTEKI